MDHVYYLIILFDLVTSIKKTNVETSMIKNGFLYEYHISSVKNKNKIHYLIISLYLVTIIKKHMSKRR